MTKMDSTVIQEINFRVSDGQTEPFKTFVSFDMVSREGNFSVVNYNGLLYYTHNFKDVKKFKIFLEDYLTYKFNRPLGQVEWYTIDEEYNLEVYEYTPEQVLQVVCYHNREKKLKKILNKIRLYKKL